MSNNKQSSSVEWLINEIEVELGIRIESTRMGCEIVEQAKAMHKEEMMDFGNDLLAQNDCNYIGIPNLAEQYYNETYESNS